MMDFSGFRGVSPRKNSSNTPPPKPKKEYTREATIKKRNKFEYLLKVKHSKAIGGEGKIVITVTHIEEGFREFVGTGKLSNKAYLIETVLQGYRKLGRIKIEDDTETDK
jgi:hypothetical protein